MKIAVIDAQGGGVGRSIVSALREKYGKGIEITALGTNVLATTAMLKAGADEGATGENAVVFMSGRMDLIMGPLGIIMGNSMLGEVTPRMANAVGSSPAEKILIPVQKCQVIIAGIESRPIQALIEEAVERAGDFLSAGSPSTNG